MNILTPAQQEELKLIDLKIAMCEQELTRLNESRREYINRHNINKFEWPDDEKRMENIMQNGNMGLHY